MYIWNFKKQDVEKGETSPLCNGVDGSVHYRPVSISYKKNGEITITSEKEKENHERNGIK